MPDCARYIDHLFILLHILFSKLKKIYRFVTSKTYLHHNTSPCSLPDRNNHCYAGCPRYGSCFCYMHASLSYGKDMFHRKQRPTFAILSFSVLRLSHTDGYKNPMSSTGSQRSFEHCKGEEIFFSFASKTLCSVCKR